jgi:hypothetical protein
MMLGHLQAQLGHRRAAEHAMKQALFLRERHGEARKARVIRRLLASFDGSHHDARTEFPLPVS